MRAEDSEGCDCVWRAEELWCWQFDSGRILMVVVGTMQRTRPFGLLS